jgi:hypothetical protein
MVIMVDLTVNAARATLTSVFRAGWFRVVPHARGRWTMPFGIDGASDVESVR